MNINTLHRALANLGATRHAFYSEADFQFALAWELQKQLPNAKIYLETPDLLAYTATVVAVSMLLEKLIRALSEGRKRRG